MTDEYRPPPMFLDLLANQHKNDASRAFLRKFLQDRLEKDIDEKVERFWEVPPMIVQPEGEYLQLLLEARELFILGFFYSCVAMCGIVNERLVKDVLRASVHIKKDSSFEVPSPKAFDQLERVEVSGITRFLKELGLLSVEAASASDELGQLRNKYAHARGKAQQPEAVEALKLLQTVVEDTVSIFKQYEIKEGKFIPKDKKD